MTCSKCNDTGEKVFDVGLGAIRSPCDCPAGEPVRALEQAQYEAKERAQVTSHMAEGIFITGLINTPRPVSPSVIAQHVADAFTAAEFFHAELTKRGIRR